MGGPSSGKEPDNNSNIKSSDQNSTMHLADTKGGAGILIPDSSKDIDIDKKECPLDKDELGAKTWGFLHTMSVYLPEGKLKPTQQTDLRSFMDLFSKFYPCEHCASDMRKDIQDEKPNVETGYSFAQWLCRLHNKTNIKLGKPVFDCNTIFERWRDGPE